MQTFTEILKFNPYHDERGRFSSANGATSFTYKPGKSTEHSRAIEREKERNNEQATKGFKGTLYHGSPAKDIEEFDMSLAGKNTSSGEKLLYFTDSKQMAEDFSYERLEGSSKYLQRRGEKGRVYEVDVEIKNPLDFRNLSDKDIDNLLKLDMDGLLTKDIVQSLSTNHQLLKASLDLRAESLIKLGYDGFIANTGKAGHNSLEYAVVDPKQAKIKKSVENVEKFNPYHDAKGRFATANGATSFTYAPGKSKAHDLAIQREKERQAAIGTKAENKATDRESAEKVLNELFDDVHINAEIDEKLLVDNANQLSELEKKFGALKATDNVEFHIDKKGFQDGETAKVEDVEQDDGVIYKKKFVLNPDAYSSKSEVEASIKYNQEEGYIADTDPNMRSVLGVTHEYGHMVQDMVIYKPYNDMKKELTGLKEKNKKLEESFFEAKDGSTRFKVLNEQQAVREEIDAMTTKMKTFRNKGAERVAIQINTEIEKICKQKIRESNPDFKGLTDDEITVSGYVSKYGRSTPFEFFAEVFTNAQCGKPNLLGEAMNEWLQQKGLMKNAN